jgi:hypothetical membrane protein
MENRSLLGSLLFVGAAQFVFALVIAEALYPGYNTAANYISDLGVGSTALLFSASVVLLGVMRFFGAVFGRQTLGTLLTVTLALSAIGGVGVGLFPETTGAYHHYFSIITFFFGAVTVILSYRVTHRPLSYFSVVLGVIALVALVLSLTHYNLDIGRGGMERMIAYSLLVWTLGFGGYMMGSK